MMMRVEFPDWLRAFYAEADHAEYEPIYERVKARLGHGVGLERLRPLDRCTVEVGPPTAEDMARNTVYVILGGVLSGLLPTEWLVPWRPAMVIPDPDDVHPKRDWEPGLAAFRGQAFAEGVAEGKDHWTVPGDEHYEHESSYSAKLAAFAFACQASVIDIQIRDVDHGPLLPGEALCPECGNVFRGGAAPGAGAMPSCRRCHQKRVVAFLLLADLLEVGGVE